MPGVTDQGFVARRQPEIKRLLIERLSQDRRVAGLNFQAGPLQDLVDVVSELVAEVWEAAEEVYASSYPGASGISLDRVAEITGSIRPAATHSRVAARCTLGAGSTLPVGSVAAVASNPDAQFRSVDAVTNTDVVPATLEAVFEAVEPGPVAAPAGSLTVIVGAVGGWTAVTNPTDAELGKPRADDVEFELLRRTELAGLGSANVDAITAAIRALEGVQYARTYQNDTMVPDAEGRPPKSAEVVLWDGTPPAADNHVIAQAIWDTIAAGIEPHGVGHSGTARDISGQEHRVAFSRATELRVFCRVEVILRPGTAAGWQDAVRSAIVEEGERYVVGDDAYASQLSCAVQSLDFVAAVPLLNISTVPPASGTVVSTTARQTVDIDSSDISVVEA